MGTPEFAVESLKALVDNKCNVVAVITAPDKPIGRGQKLGMSAVKEYVLAHADGNFFQLPEAYDLFQHVPGYSPSVFAALIPCVTLSVFS